MSKWFGVLIIVIIASFGLGLLFKPKAELAAAPQTTEIKSANLRQKISSLLIIHSSGTDPARLSAFISRYQPAGFIIMNDNIPEDSTQLKTITSSLQQASPTYPLLIATDQEGCSVKRLQQDNFACANTLKDRPVNETTEAFTKRSKLLADSGINLNFGTVADVTADKSSFIYPRVFGSNSNQAADRIAAAVEASKPYTLSTLKHFPGHGETTENTHTDLAVITIDKNTWQQRDLPPFVAGINAGAELIMFGHLNYSQIDNTPATLSRSWHQILQNELHYQGATITDDMIMLQKTKAPEYQDVVTNAVSAINAGNDLILFVNDYNLSEEPERNIDLEALLNGLVQAVQDGRIPESRINESVERVNRLRMQTNKS
jgi:beta-N-acetylhexosaminidase